MRCRRCKSGNSYKANYCLKCGKEFNQGDKDLAVNTGIVALIKKVRESYDDITLSTITGSWQFRLISIIIVLSIGIFGIIQNGIHLKVQKSDNYTYQYNDKDKEYYLYTKSDETKLNLYSLGEKEEIKVEYYDGSNKLINENTYDNIEDVVLLSAKNSNYYLLKYKKDTLKIYIYKLED